MKGMGVDLKVKEGMGGGMANKSAAKPRPGAAMGQGAGMGGYNAGTVNRAMMDVKGGSGKPTYYAGAGMGMNKK